MLRLFVIHGFITYRPNLSISRKLEGGTTNGEEQALQAVELSSSESEQTSIVVVDRAGRSLVSRDSI